MAELKEAIAIEDSIDDLSQPPYPVIPANELCGFLLLEFNRPAEATTYFQKALLRTPNRPKAIFGLALAAQALGDTETAGKRFEQFLEIWKTADPDRPELAKARAFLNGRSQEKVLSRQRPRCCEVNDISLPEDGDLRGTGQ